MHERAPRPESVQISVGTMFTIPQYGTGTERTDVVIDIGEGDWFGASQVYRHTDGRQFWRSYNSGTGGQEHIGQVVGQMTMDEMVEAARLGAELDGLQLSDTLITRIQENTAKGQRTIFLK